MGLAFSVGKGNWMAAPILIALCAPVALAAAWFRSWHDRREALKSAEQLEGEAKRRRARVWVYFGLLALCIFAIFIYDQSPALWH